MKLSVAKALRAWCGRPRQCPAQWEAHVLFFRKMKDGQLFTIIVLYYL